PAAQVLGDRFGGNGLAEEHPRLVRALRADTDFGKFSLGVFGTVAAAKAEVQPHDGGAHFKASLGHRALNVVLQNRMAGYANVPARNQGAQEELSPVPKVVTQVLSLLLAENCETRQRIAVTAADLGW